MSRSLLALLLLGVVGAAQGCRICDSPYDYCGPVMPCGESCGAGECGGHSHTGYGHGGYVESGYSGGHSGCSTCGNGGSHGMEYANEYEGETVIPGRAMPGNSVPNRTMQGQPTPAPMPAPPMAPQTRGTSPRTLTKATYDAPAPITRSPYPAARAAKKNSGPIFW
jgi:hypothetical protein